MDWKKLADLPPEQTGPRVELKRVVSLRDDLSRNLEILPTDDQPHPAPAAATHTGLSTGVCIYVASLLSEQARRFQSELHASKPTSPSTCPACPSTREARGSSALG